MNEYDGHLGYFRETLARTALWESPESFASLRHFKLRRRQRGAVAGVDLVFVGGDFKRTIITADLGLGINAVVSVRGIGVDELVAAASSPDLASWFLERQWSRERAYDDIRALIRRAEAMGEAELVEGLQSTHDCLHEEWMDESAFRDSATNAGVAEDAVPGYGYDARDQALLQALAERFAEVYTSSRASESG